MASELLLSSFFWIFGCAAILATAALFTRQPLLVAYIVLGGILGPHGLGLTADPDLLADISSIGIIFLLFLLGLDLQPRNLLHVMRKSSLVAISSSLVLAAVGYLVARAFGYAPTESLVIGISVIFSSTIIGIKLLPTTVLHHRYTGELVVGLLLLQDLIAILVLIFIHGGQVAPLDISHVAGLLLALPGLTLAAFAMVRYVLLPLLRRYDRFHEYIFLMALGWCLGLAQIAHLAGLSHEIGAFIAGISLANSPISQYIAESLKPLRDFFLVLFFFALGAGFNLGVLDEILIPSLALVATVLLLKPFAYFLVLRLLKEPAPLAREVGIRLAQTSEFSLLISYLASDAGLIGMAAAHTIQATTILTFLFSSYIVVFTYPTPIGVSEKLRRD